MFVYKTINLINGKIYIGKSIKNPRSYMGGGVYLRIAIKKYGKQNFIKKVIEENISDMKILNEREQYWIKHFNSTNPKIGYNRSNGGDGFSGERTSEEKEKISINHADVSGEKNPWYGKSPSDETRKLMSINHADFAKEKSPKFGKSVPEETRKKMSESKKGKYIGKKSPLFGIPRTNREKKKISKSLRLYYSNGNKNAMAGKYHARETKLILSQKAISKKTRKNTSSKYVGVSYNKKEKKWKSSIKIFGENKFHIGSFQTEIEAAMAYNEILLEYYGWKAKNKINIISNEDMQYLWNLNIEEKRQGNAKLKASEIKEIKKLLQDNKLNFGEIGDIFGVSSRYVRRIKNEEVWKDV